jgi:cardiolipin synthase A/B
MSSPAAAQDRPRGRPLLDERSRVLRPLEGLLGIPATEGNRIDVLRNGDEIFPAMLEAIGAATRTVDLLTFIYWSGDIGQRFAEALRDRALAGVRVRVLLDAVGARRMDSTLLDLMADGGCDVRWFRPVRRGKLGEVDRRTHRKVLVCDEQVGFTGGVGIADNWLGDARDENEWRDTHFRVVGPATDGLRAAFVGNWAETDGELFDLSVDRFPEQPGDGSATVQVVRGAAETGWSDMATLFRALLVLAEQRVRITTAYFNPDDTLAALLCATARRGVAVEVLVPGAHIDKRFVRLLGRAQYDRMTEAGVRIHEFQPTMLHAKIMTVDGLVANVGSANVNHRSAELDEEVNLVVHDREVVRILDRHFEEDLERSQPVDPDGRDRRGLREQVKAALLSPLRRQV